MANEVVVKVRADTKKAQRSLNDLKGSGDKLNTGIKRAAKGGAIALAALGTAAAASAVKMAVEFEAAMSEVRTLIPDASNEAFGKLNADLATFMRDMNVASADAVPALYSALSAGVPPDNVIDFLRVAFSPFSGAWTPSSRCSWRWWKWVAAGSRWGRLQVIKWWWRRTGSFVWSHPFPD